MTTESHGGAVESTSRLWYIYVLIDPRTEDVRYVGWTAKPTKRLAKHIKHAKEGQQSHRCRWIRTVLEAGLKPVLRFIEQGEGEDTWQEAEQRWIAHYRAQGASLTNATDGGEGMLGWKHSEEHKARLSERLKGNTLSAGCTWNVGRKQSEEHKAKLAAVHATPEWKAKASAARKGKPHSPETIEKMRRTHTTEEARAKSREMSKAQFSDEEKRARWFEARWAGRCKPKLSEEEKARKRVLDRAKNSAAVAASNRRRAEKRRAELLATSNRPTTG